MLPNPVQSSPVQVDHCFPSGVISVPLTAGSAGPQGKPELEYVIFTGSVGELYLNCEELVGKEACRGGINSSFCSQQLGTIQSISDWWICKTKECAKPMTVKDTREDNDVLSLKARKIITPLVTR